MKAILIRQNEMLKTVTGNVEFDKNDINMMNDLIGSMIFTSAGYLDNGDGVLVDDEGMLSMSASTMITKMRHYPQPLVGNIMVTGVDHKNGDSTDAKSDVEYVEACIEWSMPLLDAIREGYVATKD